MDKGAGQRATEHYEAGCDAHLTLNGNRSFAVFDLQPRVDRGEGAAFDDDGLRVASGGKFLSSHARALAALAENVNGSVGACALAVGGGVELVERV